MRILILTNNSNEEEKLIDILETKGYAIASSIKPSRLLQLQQTKDLDPRVYSLEPDRKWFECMSVKHLAGFDAIKDQVLSMPLTKQQIAML